MRAILKGDPQAGPGYCIMDIYGAAGAMEPRLVVRRMKDGMSLAPGGWKSGENDIFPSRYETADDYLRLWLGPEFADELEFGGHYEVCLPGIGSCALEIAGLPQTSIISGDRNDSPAQGASEPELAANEYEDVEATPEVVPSGGFGGPSGVAAAPESEAEPDQQPKKKGCLYLCVFLSLFWIAGGIYLWKGAMNAPISKDEDSPIFEIIPKASESSVPGDMGDEEGASSKP